MSTRDVRSQDVEVIDIDEDEYGSYSEIIVNPDRQNGKTCPLCLEPWNNSRDHRLVALQCGHLFGAKCIQNLLSCPTCKSTIDFEEIRCIYAKKLTAVNIATVPLLKKQVETLKAKKTSLETELRSIKLAHRACLNEIAELRDKMKDNTKNKWKFSLDIKAEMFNARVLAFNNRTLELYVSDNTSKIGYTQYGVRMLDCVNYKRVTLPLNHKKPISAMSYCQKNDMLVTASLDGTASLQPRTGSGTSWMVDTGAPLWSCKWDTFRDKQIHFGAAGGLIYSYDYRNLSEPVSLMVNATDTSPVVSVCPTDYGLLSCSYASCLEWTGSNITWDYKPLPVPGPYSSICYDEESGRLVINCRKITHRSRLHIYKLRGTGVGQTTWEEESSIHGLSTSASLAPVTWVRVPDAVWVASYDDRDSCLKLYGMDGAENIRLPAPGAISGICSGVVDGGCLLSALSETRLNIFKGTASPYF